MDDIVKKAIKAYLSGVMSLSFDEKVELIRRFKLESGLSERAIAKEFNIPHTTVHYWMVGDDKRKRHSDAVSLRYKTKDIKYRLVDLIDYFKVFKPKLKEFEKVEELHRILGCISRREYNKI